MRFSAVGRSELGLVRLNNEDAWRAEERFAVVSDGVGGRPAGEVASTLAVAVFAESLSAGMTPDRAVHAASRIVQETALANSLLTGMCATLTAAVADADGVTVVHVGDSTAWLVREGELRKLTSAQTVAAHLLAAGEITAEEALTHPKRGTLHQVVGGQNELSVDTIRLEARPGDRLVLATDGLDYVPAVLLEPLLAAPKPGNELADALVAAALDVGGIDNVTVVIADVALA